MASPTKTAVPAADAPLQLRFPPFELDERQAPLSRAGQVVAVPPKAFAVLCALTRRPGQLVLKDELLDAVWGHRHVTESVLKTTISELRAVLGDAAKQPRYIETASRRGYRFIAALQSAAAATAEPAGSDASRPKGGAAMSPAANGSCRVWSYLRRTRASSGCS